MIVPIFSSVYSLRRNFIEHYPYSISVRVTKPPTKVAKSTPSSAEPTALSEGDYIPLTTHVQRPTTAVSKGNSCNTDGYSVNTTQSTLLERPGVRDTTGNDRVSNSSGGDGGQKRNKALVRSLISNEDKLASMITCGDFIWL